MAALSEALRRDDSQEALELIRGLVERVTLTPAAEGGFDIELVGEIAAMVRLGLNPGANNHSGTTGSAAVMGSALFSGSVKVVAGTRNRRSHHSTVAIWP
jgi:hypothetical protein